MLDGLEKQCAQFVEQEGELAQLLQKNESLARKQVSNVDSVGSNGDGIGDILGVLENCMMTMEIMGREKTMLEQQLEQIQRQLSSMSFD